MREPALRLALIARVKVALFHALAPETLLAVCPELSRGVGLASPQVLRLYNLPLAPECQPHLLAALGRLDPVADITQGHINRRQQT